MPESIITKAIFSSIDGKRGFFIFQNQNLIKASFDLNERLAVGTIVMGRLEHRVENLDAAFVEYEKGIKGFLKKCKNHKGNDLFPVQITKNPVKTKDAELSLEFEIKGLYAILKDKPGGLYLSNKISKDKGNDIKDSLSEIVRSEYTIIVRSNALSLYPEDLSLLQDEISSLYEVLDDVKNKANSRSQFNLLYKGTDFTIDQLADVDFNTLDEVITDDQECFDLLVTKLPNHMHARLRFYDDTSVSLSNLYGIRGKIRDAIQKKIWLKSGGYLVVEPTEAMLVIDVNSGKNTSKISKDKLIDITNWEALEMVAKLLSLLNISGMILIDFLNYPDRFREDKEMKLLQFMKEQTKDDVMDVKVVDMTPLGIMELTRAKKEMTLVEQLKEVHLYETIKSL